MSDVLSALAPVFILITLGYIIRAANIASAEAMGHVNRFGYFVLYPAFLFTLSSSADFSAPSAPLFVAGVIAGFAVMIALSLALRFVFRGDGPAFTSVFQGSARWNGFTLLGGAAALYGPQGPNLIGLAFGPLVLVVNLVCVLVLSRWGANRATSARAVLDQIVVNPLILGCFAGLCAQAAGLRDFGPISDALQLVGQAAMPVALICVGSGLDLRALRADGPKVATACAMKLIVAPFVLWHAVTLLGGDPISAAVAAGIGSTPTAAAGYTLAREMGGDARLMAAIITATTIVSFITMPIAIALASP